MNRTDRCRIEVNISQLRENYRILREMLVPPCQIIGVVKSNAYGLGAVQIARELQELGCSLLAAADLREAAELRDGGVTVPLLLLGPIEGEQAASACEMDVAVPVVSAEHAVRLERAAASLGRTLKVHVKIDSGLSRFGIPIAGRENEAIGEVIRAASQEHLCCMGLMTHISGVTEKEKDYLNVQQLERFRSFGQRLEQAGYPMKMHCESSLLYLSHPEYEMDYVRLTSAILGIQPGYEQTGVEPIASLKTKLLQIKSIPKGAGIGYWMTYLAPRDMRIGIAGIGYGDGLIRSLCGGAEMLVRGKRVPVVGKLSMNSCVLDLTDVPECAEGDTVTVIGRDGEEEVTVHEYAARYGGHPCEVICMLRESIPKVYFTESPSP